LIVYSVSIISAKNYQNRSMRVEVIACNISVFFETQCLGEAAEVPKPAPPDSASTVGRIAGCLWRVAAISE